MPNAVCWTKSTYALDKNWETFWIKMNDISDKQILVNLLLKALEEADICCQYIHDCALRTLLPSCNNTAL